MQPIAEVPFPDVAAWFGRPVAAWQADRCKRYLDEAHGRADLVATVLGRG